MPGQPGDTKICVSCGREMTWRKSWERNWDQVRHCSNGCRKRRVSDVDKALEAAILELLDARARDASICPSEVARLVAGEQWQEALEPTRRAARRLVAEGLVVITQKGQVVDPSTAKGPIRIRRIRP